MRHDSAQWHCVWRLEKYANDTAYLLQRPYAVYEREGNMLVTGGASALWERLVGTSVDAFDGTNAHIGVGDSSTAESASQTDLQGTDTRKGMEDGYPSHTDSTSSSSAEEVTFRSVFAGSDANHAWNEWGVFNAATLGRMLNRKVESLGTKASGSTWTLTVTLSLSS